MRIRRGLAAAAALLTLTATGCWPQLGSGSGNTHFNDHESSLTADNVTGLHQRWMLGSRYDTYSPPVVWGNRMFSTRTTYFDPGPVTVDALSVSTGNGLWSHQLLTGANGTTDAYATPVVYVDGALWVSYRDADTPSCTSHLVRLDPGTGDVLSSELTPEVTSHVVNESNVVVHLGRDGCSSTPALVVRDATTRQVQWTFTFPAGDSPTVPTIAGGRIFVSAGAHLYSFLAGGCGQATCQPDWATSAEAGQFRGRTVAASAGTLLVRYATSATAANAPHVRSVAAANGTVLWSTQSSDPAHDNVQGVSVGYDKIYVNEGGATTDRLALYPIGGCGAATCAPSWTVPFGTVGLREMDPAVGGNVVYVVDGPSAALVAVDARGCGAATCGELHRVVQPSPYTGLGRDVVLSSGHLLSTMDGSFLTSFGV